MIRYELEDREMVSHAMLRVHCFVLYQCCLVAVVKATGIPLSVRPGCESESAVILDTSWNRDSGD